MNFFIVLTLSGLAAGMIYSALALSLVIIWRATRVVNFAQGALAMTTTYIALAVIQATGDYWIGFISALVAGLVLGAIAERFLVRWVEAGPPLKAVVLPGGLLLRPPAGLRPVWGAPLPALPAPPCVAA